MEEKSYEKICFNYIVYDGVTYNVTAKGKINKMNDTVFEKLQDNAFITENGEFSGHLSYAKKLVETLPISRRALKLILETRKLNTDVVEYVMANINLDWKAQAVKCANKYLDYRHYDRKILTSILMLEGFTESEAKYGTEIAVVSLESNEASENDKLQDMLKYIEEMKNLAATIQ